MGLSYAGPLSPSPTINVALIGPPKTGKTTGAASAPGPILLLNCDLPNATRFARLRYPGVKEATFAAGETEHTVAVMQMLTDVTHAAHADEFKTVVIDPVGELYRLLLEEQARRALRPTLPTRGDVSVYLERFLRALCEAPVNVVFVCHQHLVTEGEDDARETLVLPFMGTSTTKLAMKLLGMVDIIGYTGVVQTEDGPVYQAQLCHGKGRSGGDRFDCLADPDTGTRETNISEWLDTVAQAEKQTSTTKKEDEK